MRGDGKDKFYRTLNLDEATKKALRFYRVNVEELKKEKEQEEEENEKT